jgi:small subunit ribosomal protein S2
MALPEFSMRGLLEAGAHFGHQTHRWNPKMDRYIFGSRANIHIIDLSQSIPLLHQALVQIRDVAAKGGRVLFVGTKRQASDPVAEAAKRCAQYYVNHRWLGGTLTNWRTVSGSIARLRELEGMLDGGEAGGRSKKELLTMTRERDKLELSLGGIKDMGGIPDIMFVIDTNKESIAIQEARKLNIPVVAILDTNSDPDGITYPIPGNDDAARAIQMYCDLVADAAIDGLASGQAASGVDLGAMENPNEPALRRPGSGRGRPAEAAPVADGPADPAQDAAMAQASEPAAADSMPQVEPVADTASLAMPYDEPKAEPPELKAEAAGTDA